MQRRRFIQRLTAAVAVCAGVGLPRQVGAGSWGAFPAWAKPLALPVSLQPKQVFEVFLNGGLSPWESLYCVDDPTYGKVDAQMWFTFQGGKNDNILSLLQSCYPNAPTSPKFFAKDALGMDVKLSPLIDALSSRPDLLDRLRVHVMSHNLFPHVPARQLAATGTAPGAPYAVGLGAAIAHYGLLTSPLEPLPRSWQVRGKDEFSGANAVGVFPATVAPTEVILGSKSTLGLGDVLNEVDALMPQLAGLNEAAAADLRQRLTPPGTKKAVRSRAAADHSAALIQIEKQALGKTILPKGFGPGASGTMCGQSYEHDFTTAGFSTAAHLLRFKGNNTRYVSLVESGVSESTVMMDGLDFHASFAPRAVQAYPHIFDRLCASIAKPNENAPLKIDLDDTLILLTTEFGRAPGLQGAKSQGRNHLPTAYVTAMLGGPLHKAQRGIVGAINKKAQPITPLHPADTRAATLFAMGIWPFSPGLFSYGDITGAKSELDAIKFLRTVVLGVPL